MTIRDLRWALLACALASCRHAAAPPAPSDLTARCAECARAAADTLLFAKGRLGPLGDGIYVGVEGPRNFVIIQATKSTEEVRWTGKPAGQVEVVLVFERQVWSADALPARFDMSRAIVLSFEAERIRVLDLARARGGYFLRVSPEGMPDAGATPGVGSNASDK